MSRVLVAVGLDDFVEVKVVVVVATVAALPQPARSTMTAINNPLLSSPKDRLLDTTERTVMSLPLSRRMSG